MTLIKDKVQLNIPFFKPKTVVCHFGYDLKRYESFRDEWIENSLETWSWLGEHLNELGSQTTDIISKSSHVLVF